MGTAHLKRRCTLIRPRSVEWSQPFRGRHGHNDPTILIWTLTLQCVAPQRSGNLFQHLYHAKAKREGAKRAFEFKFEFEFESFRV